MEKGRSLFLIYLILLLTFHCKGKTEKNKEVFPIHDEKFHFVLYADPSTDCLDCIFTAIGLLGKHQEQNDPIELCLTPTSHNDNFKRLLVEEFKERKFLFVEYKINLPHPSILLIKGNSVYMHMYVPNDRFLLRDYVSICAQFFSNINTQ